MAEPPITRNIDRRKFINGGWTERDDGRTSDVEIASILVQARPEHLDAAARAIEALPGAQIYSRDPKGKLVVVIEAADTGSIGATLNAISLSARCADGSTGVPRHRCQLSTHANRRPAMKKKPLDRREFLKLEAAAMAAAAGGLPAPLAAQNLVTDRSITELKWNKAPCRFCGTGCGVMVATKDGRVVATHGDTKAEVNRGLNCVKGYFLSKIMYGHDRLTHPLLRKKNGKYDKNGEFTPGVLGRGVRRDGAAVQSRACKARAERRRHVRVGPMDDLGRLRGEQAVQGRFPLQQPRPECASLHGVGRHGLHADVRHGRADGMLRRLRGRRRFRAVGLEHGGDAPDPLEPGHRPPAQRAACSCRGAIYVRASLLRSRRHCRWCSRRRPISRS